MSLCRTALRRPRTVRLRKATTAQWLRGRGPRRPAGGCGDLGRPHQFERRGLSAKRERADAKPGEGRCARMRFRVIGRALPRRCWRRGRAPPFGVSCRHLDQERRDPSPAASRPHGRRLVPGQALSCSGCNSGLFVVAVSPADAGHESPAPRPGRQYVHRHRQRRPPAVLAAVRSRRAASLAKSNCIDIAYSINTQGTYGTAASLATCGENNLNGITPLGYVPNGICQTNGIRIARQGLPHRAADVAVGGKRDKIRLMTGPIPQAEISIAMRASLATSSRRRLSSVCMVSLDLRQPLFSIAGSTNISYGDVTTATSRNMGMEDSLAASRSRRSPAASRQEAAIRRGHTLSLRRLAPSPPRATMR